MIHRLRLALLIALSGMFIISGCSKKRSGPPRILVFTKTAGYYHKSIPDGVLAIMKLGRENDFLVDSTSDASKFTEDLLKQYSAVVFLSTTHEVLNNYQQADFERYIEAGGGFVGVHAASDCGYTWPWYGKLVGAYFHEHPEIQQAKLIIHKDSKFPVTDSLPNPWIRTDEWYNFRKVPQNVHVLVSIDEHSYHGGENGANHPMVWYHKYDGGRSFYMELGHTSASFKEPDFLKLLLAGIQYAIGDNEQLDYSKATAFRVPAEERFSKEFLAGGLDEPTELTVLPNLDVLIGERKGNIKFYNAKTKTISVAAHLDVYCKTTKKNTNVEMGLLGIQKDPEYSQNHWIYVYYSPMSKSVDRLSRFKFQNNQFSVESEQIILEVPTERDMCCHTGGSIAFDKEGNLYLSVGDNSTPFDEVDSITGKAFPINTHGYAPLDDRPGYDHYDDRRSAGNTNDLRGKILRIKVNQDGSYSVPVGNLFPPGTPKTRPEIYVMGDRNPYRISVDQHTGFLYWGEVGPDADNDSMTTRGPRGYDEIDQARHAGNFGWPYFVGNNYAYHEYNYGTGQSGPAFNPMHPVNDSRNNTGLRDLPPAQPAFIWYPYAQSPDFPILGQGGRCSMAGPVYYVNDFPDSSRYDPYYNRKLFIYDWIRNWIMVVSMDKKGNLQTIEPFMPHTKFHNISDMEVGPDGRLYIVEYGEGWFTKNPDAALSVLSYNGGNVAPIVKFQVNRIAGSLPLKIHMSAKGTYDVNGDSMTYRWHIGPGSSKETKTNHNDIVLNKAGVYSLSVDVTDSKGATTSSQTFKVFAGNSEPQVRISTDGNQMFYFKGLPIHYEVRVFDREDGSSQNPGFDKSRVMVQAGAVSGGQESPKEGDQAQMALVSGKTLMESLDCQSCHKINQKSIGPAFDQVAMKYKGNLMALDYLPNKIIKGGSGVWGVTAMAAHPNLSEADAREIVSWILSLSDTGKVISLPMQGSLDPQKYKPSIGENLRISASYADKGAPGVPSLTGYGSLLLKSPLIPDQEINIGSGFQSGNIQGTPLKLLSGPSGSLYLRFIDLKDVNGLVLNFGLTRESRKGFQVEAHLDSANGPLLGTTHFGSIVGPMIPQKISLKISPIKKSGNQTLYLVFRRLDPSEMGDLAIANLILTAQ